jgi:acyl-CoA thioesterase
MDALQGALDAEFRRNPFLRALGIELVDWGPGWARTRLAPDRGLTNLAGTVHGGAITSLADVAFEVACNSYGRESVALDLTCHFTAPARGGALVAEAEEVTRSRRTASYRVTVTEGAGIVAWLLAVAYRTDRWRLGAERYPDDWRDTH